MHKKQKYSIFNAQGLMMQRVEQPILNIKPAGRWVLDARHFNMVIMTAGGIITFFLSFIVVMTARLWIYPGRELELGLSWWFFPVVIGAVLAVIVLHELLHAAAFLVTGGKPRLGFSLVARVYAVAQATATVPLTRNRYLFACLLPAVVMTPALLAGAFVAGSDLSAGILLIALGMNAGGSIGDIIMARSIRQHSPDTLFEDNEHGFTWYLSDDQD